MEYALVNIVMGDIDDIEKKKSAGLTNLLLGAKAPALGLPGGIKQPKSFHAVQDIVQDFVENKEQEVKINMSINSDTKNLLALNN